MWWNCRILFLLQLLFGNLANTFRLLKGYQKSTFHMRALIDSTNNVLQHSAYCIDLCLCSCNFTVRERYGFYLRTSVLEKKQSAAVIILIMLCLHRFGWWRSYHCLVINLRTPMISLHLFAARIFLCQNTFWV